MIVIKHKLGIDVGGHVAVRSLSEWVEALQLKEMKKFEDNLADKGILYQCGTDHPVSGIKPKVRKMENRSYYEQNRDAYLQKLIEIDREMRDGLAGVKNRRFMVYHPAFGYFAREYNLTMIPLEKEGKEPTAAGLVHLIEQAKVYDSRVIFAEPQFDPKSAEVIARAIGGRVVLIDPLAKDYIGNLRLILNEMLPAME